MTDLMSITSGILLYIYICCYGVASVSIQSDELAKIQGGPKTSLRTGFGDDWNFLTSSRAGINHHLPVRDATIEDLEKLNIGRECKKLSNNIVGSERSDNSIDVEYSDSPSETTTIFSNVSDSTQPDDALDDLEKVEMHTNNHQSVSNNGHHSRHYNTYQMGTGNLPLGGHYNGKFTSSHATSSSNFADNINLSYIHSLLTKPSSSNSLSSLLNPNSNTITQYNSSPYLLSLQNAYSSSYYSSPQISPSISNNIIDASGGTSSNLVASNSASSLNQQVSKQPQSMSVSNANHDQQNSIINNPDDSMSSSICGRQQVSSREPRIVGGNNTYEGEFPWAVSIQRHGNHHCGGVIVGKRWILTAAHCVRSQLVGNLVVRTGGHTLSRSGNSLASHLERDYLVDQIVMHDDFSRYDNLTASQIKSSANTNNADIALIRLKHDILWNEFAWPVCFPQRDSGSFSGHDATVIGWGKLNEKSEDFSNELQKVKLTIIDNKVCQNWFRQAGRDMPIDDRIICAGFKNGGKDACHGDSGGPLLSKINGHYVVVGVVSTGIGCARPLLPGLYSRVSSYINWIERYVS